jgi:nucleoside-diphosphate-sugar epimerase
MQIQNNLINTALHMVSKIYFLGSSLYLSKNGSSTAKRRVFTTGPLEPTNEWYAIAKFKVKACSNSKAIYKDYVSLMPTTYMVPMTTSI